MNSPNKSEELKLMLTNLETQKQAKEINTKNNNLKPTEIINNNLIFKNNNKLKPITLIEKNNSLKIEKK